MHSIATTFMKPPSERKAETRTGEDGMKRDTTLASAIR